MTTDDQGRLIDLAGGHEAIISRGRALVLFALFLQLICDMKLGNAFFVKQICKRILCRIGMSFRNVEKYVDFLAEN